MSRGDKPVPISRMAAAVQPSATLAAGALARQLRARGAWWSEGATVPAAVAALARHLEGGGPARHFVTQSR